jgi:uncharacterized membrane protein
MGDPYQPPVVDVSPPDVRSADSIQVFEKFSTWYVLGLALITMGLYNVYWLFSRSRRLNRLKYIEPVSEGYMQVTTVAFILSYPVSIAEVYMADYPEFLIFSQVFWVATMIMVLVWGLMFRNRLNTFLERSSTKTSLLSPVLTFFFQVIYLSFKVNQNLELAEESAEEAAEQGDTA